MFHPTSPSVYYANAWLSWFNRLVYAIRSIGASGGSEGEKETLPELNIIICANYVAFVSLIKEALLLSMLPL